MSFEPRIEKVVSNYKRRLGEMQSQIEARLQVPTGEDVQKIMCTNVRVNIPSASVSSNAINFDGDAMVQVVYENQDGKVGAIDYTLEFKDRYMTKSEMMLAEVIIGADVVDIKSYIENGSVRVVAILNITIDGIMADTRNIVVSATGEDVYTKYEDICYSSYIGMASEKFDITNDIEIKDAVSKVLCVCPRAIIDKVESHENYLKVYGSIATTITYITSGDNEDIRTCDNISEFSQEIALTGISSDSYVNSTIACVYQSMIITTNLGTDKSVVNMILPVEYRGYVWSDKDVQMVSDMYSPNYCIELVKSTIVAQHQNMPMMCDERISGSYTLDDNMLAVDEILGTTCNNIVVANYRIEDGVVIVDGLATTTVIYKNFENKKMQSVDIQLPFSVDLTVGDIDPNANINIVAGLGKVQAKARRGTDIELGADVLVLVEIAKTSVIDIVSGARVTEGKNVCDANLMIYVAKEGDTIWDIAKEMSVPEDMILAQNPDLELPIVAGQRVVVYRQSLARIE